MYQVRPRNFTVVARTSGDAQPVIAAIRRAINGLSSAVPVLEARTGEQLYAAQVARERFAGAVLTAFAALALTLTVIGVYGVIAYGVSRQRHQIGVRMALGATRGDVLRAVLADGVPFIGLGLAAGVIAAFGLTHLLSSLIYGVTATDPATFAAAAALVAAIALVGCLIPAARATRIDPLIALRAE